MPTADDVKGLAKLARLNLSEEETTRLKRELPNIIEYVQQIDKANTDNVEPMSHSHGAVNVMRDDKAESLLESEEALANAPDRSGRFIRVPIIIDQ